MNNKTNTEAESPTFLYDYVCLAPDEQIDLHEGNDWELACILTGAGKRLIGDTTGSFTEGEVVLIPPHIPHCWYFDKEVTDAQGRISNIAIFFGSEFLHRCGKAFPQLLPYINKVLEMQDAILFDGERAEMIRRIMEDMHEKTEAEHVPAMLSLLLLIADSEEGSIIGKYRKMSKETRRLNQIKTYISCNARRDITIDDIASHVGMNRSAFCVFFKKATGRTFITYLNEFRVELACGLLAQGELSISEVCFQAGFNNISYFNRIFKRLKGVTPSGYLKK